jgi:hypothetical protein
MKVFSNLQKPTTATSKRGKEKAPIKTRENLSDSQIRDRLAKGLGKDTASAKKAVVKEGAQVSEYMSGKPGKIVKVPPKSPMERAEAESKAKSLLHKSDVNLNDPNDPVTQGKLKNILKMGSFNFSDKEKAALSNILGPSKA